MGSHRCCCLPFASSVPSSLPGRFGASIPSANCKVGQFIQTLGGRNRTKMPVQLARLSPLTDESLGLFCIVRGDSCVLVYRGDALAFTCGVS